MKLWYFTQCKSSSQLLSKVFSEIIKQVFNSEHVLEVMLRETQKLQSWTKFMKQCQEIKQNWTGQENFEICFCVIFDH